MSFLTDPATGNYLTDPLTSGYMVDDINTLGDPAGVTVETAIVEDDNIVLSWPNYITQATLSSPDTWVSTLPLANLKDPVFSNIAKVSATAATINATFANFTQIGTIAFANHSLSSGATVRVSLYYDTAQTQLIYDSGLIDVWTRVYNSLDLLWEDASFWDGRPSNEDRAAYTTLFYAYMPQNYGAKSVKIVIDDPANPDGFMTFGRLMLSKFFTPFYNASYGLKYTPKSNTSLTFCNGTAYAREAKQNRLVTFNLDYLSRNEAFKKIWSAMRSQDINKELLYSERKARDQYSIETSIIGRFEQLSPLDQPSFDLFANPINLIEIL